MLQHAPPAGYRARCVLYRREQFDLSVQVAFDQNSQISLPRHFYFYDDFVSQT